METLRVSQSSDFLRFFGLRTFFKLLMTVVGGVALQKSL